MFWYIVICALMLYPLSIDHAGNLSEKKTKHLALAIACLILWFFMAMRSTAVGVDTKYYSYVFTQFPDIPLSKIFTAVTYATDSKTWTFDFEPGYRIVNKLLSFLTDSPQAITIFNSTLIMLLLYSLIEKRSPNFLLSVWLYITLGVYQTEMNVTRNAIAILIVYHAFPYAQKRDFKMYLLFCLLAASFHAAALMFIPVYWLIHHLRLTPRGCMGLLAASCMVGVIFPFISPYIRMVLPGSLNKYFEDSNERMESLMVGMLNGGIFLASCMLLTPRERKRVFSEYQLGILMLMLNLCFFGLNIGLKDASRMAALFGPYLIIFIPQILSLIESRTRRENAAAIITAMCAVVYVLRLCINNIGGTMPYQFFW